MIAWRRVLLFLILCAITQPGFAVNTYITIPDGNVEALKSALADSYSLPALTHVIVLGGTFQFGPDDELPEVRTTVSIFAGRKPAYFTGLDGGPTTLIRVAQGGSLQITNIEFQGFDPVVHGDSGHQGLLVNDGSLFLSKTQFRDNTAQLECGQEACADFKPLITNTASGEFRAALVSVIDSGVMVPEPSVGLAAGALFTNHGTARLQNVQLYIRVSGYAPPFRNSGQMWLTNATLKSNESEDQSNADWIISPGRLQLANSVISGFGHGWCENVISAGFNLVENPACGISSREDIVGTSAGLRWRPVVANWQHREEQILTHALVPIAASPAVDSANDAWCPPVSLHQEPTRNTTRPRDGDNDGDAACDRGAYEIARKFLATGGINGLYFNPDADGHYVYIADTRFNTMVMWTTFDARGEQAWIFGIAREAVAGRSLIADAYINRDGRVSLTGQFDPATSEPWGRLEVDLASCDEGDFLFASDLPGFGSGRFEIRRLAHVKRLGCEFPGED